MESFPETPLIVITLCFITINIAAARSGIEVIAKDSDFLFASGNNSFSLNGDTFHKHDGF